MSDLYLDRTTNLRVSFWAYEDNWCAVLRVKYISSTSYSCTNEECCSRTETVYVRVYPLHSEAVGIHQECQMCGWKLEEEYQRIEVRHHVFPSQVADPEDCPEMEVFQTNIAWNLRHWSYRTCKEFLGRMQWGCHLRRNLRFFLLYVVQKLSVQQGNWVSDQQAIQNVLYRVQTRWSKNSELERCVVQRWCSGSN